MSKFDIIMPKLGESVQEATITKWFKNVGDNIEEEDALLEIATDKVDSEIPSPVDGVVEKILFEEGAVVAVGEKIAVINLSGEIDTEENESDKAPEAPPEKPKEEEKDKTQEASDKPSGFVGESDKFFSPLVRSIAEKEGISVNELESIQGSGINERVTKTDVITYLDKRGSNQATQGQQAGSGTAQQPPKAMKVTINEGDEVVAMDRMRKKIAEHMVMSKQVSPHVTSMVEADVTNLVKWRGKTKDQFLKREGHKLSFMPAFIQATAKALRDFPQVNASVDGDNIILRKKVNIGIAVALPSGNLIVPVIKNADQLNFIGISNEMDRLVQAARNNKLSPDDIAEGTFSISNFGSFRNVMGTPIINQPQVAIMAVGTIEKKPAVLETPAGDVIAIRHKMFLSLSYDHRVVDGALGGAFIRKVGDYLEGFDTSMSF